METFTYNADDPEQRAWVESRLRERDLRVQELWRFVLGHEKSREWLMTVLFAEVGPFNVIPTEPPAEAWGGVALHNVGRTWLVEYVWPHRDLYKQMVAEYLDREKKDREVRESKQAEWRARRSVEDQGVSDGD